MLIYKYINSFSAILLLIFVVSQDVFVLQSWNDLEAEADSIKADIIQVPEGIYPPNFAYSLVEAQGLQPFAGGEISESREGPMGYAGIISNERNVRVYYSKEWRNSSINTVCRVLDSRRFMNANSHRASGWCANHFGVQWLEPTPIIVQGPPVLKAK